MFENTYEVRGGIRPLREILAGPPTRTRALSPQEIFQEKKNIMKTEFEYFQQDTYAWLLGKELAAQLTPKWTDVEADAYSNPNSLYSKAQNELLSPSDNFDIVLAEVSELTKPIRAAIARKSEENRAEECRLAAIPYQDDLLSLETKILEVNETSKTWIAELTDIRVRFYSYQGDLADLKFKPTYYISETADKSRVWKEVDSIFSSVKHKLRQIICDQSLIYRISNAYKADVIKMHIFSAMLDIFYARIRIQTHPVVALDSLYIAKKRLYLARFHMMKMLLSDNSLDGLHRLGMSMLLHDMDHYQQHCAAYRNGRLTDIPYADPSFVDNRFTGRFYEKEFALDIPDDLESHHSSCVLM